MPEEIAIKYRQADITPFWKKLPFFFLFPFRFGPLIFMACIIAASALAGITLGGFGLAFKGFLVYLGLRYSFNVLELFSKGRFEGESVDYTLWGPEKRPAKLGLVIALFITVGINLGNVMLDSRLAKDVRAQEVIIDRYKKEHAAEIAQREQEMAAYKQRVAEVAAARARAPKPEAYAGSGDEDSDSPASSGGGSVAAAEFESMEPAPDAGPSRGDILQSNVPGFGDPLWFRLQPVSFWFVMVVLSLLLPSAAILIALEDKFFKSLNPLFVLHFVQTMGSAYFALWAFFLAIAGSRQLVLSVGSQLSPAVSFPIEMGVATYLALVLFAIMGYALYQFHQELHLDVDVDFDEHRQAGGAEGIAKAGSARAALQEAAPKDPLERKLQPLLADGKVKEAIAEVKDFMRYDRYDAALNTRLHGLYALQGDPAVTLEHGHQWLTALARAGQGKEALAALRKLMALDPAFAVQDGDVVLPTATAAAQASDPALAADLLRNFDKRFPKHKDTPAVFFLGAKLLSEQSRQHEKAAKILRAVLAHFPDHAVAEEARTYLAVLESMLAKAHPAA
jgi:tetratricopeptide (TPR) repeat protein